MDIHMFETGQKVYVLDFRRNGRIKDSEVREMYVQKIGRKYVYAAGDMQSQYQVRFKQEYYSESRHLKEDVDFGHPMLLFESLKDLEDFREYETLKIWFGNYSTREKLFTLEQLRMAKAALDCPQEVHHAIEQALCVLKECSTVTPQGICDGLTPLMELLTGNRLIKKEG